MLGVDNLSFLVYRLPDHEASSQDSMEKTATWPEVLDTEMDAIIWCDFWVVSVEKEEVYVPVEKREYDCWLVGSFFLSSLI